MTKFLLVTIFVFITAITNAQSKVTANINNLKSDKGVCRVCLFNDANAFTGEGGQPYECLVVPAKNKSAQVIFNNVQPGTYAMFVFHDVNNNNKIDKNMFGIPKEGYGASKNKLPFTAAPKFDENKFDVSANKSVSLNIQLRYIF